MATSPGEARVNPDEVSAITRKLVWRMGLAGLMIAALLAGLAVFDRFGAAKIGESEAPRFSGPVPVQQKTATQAVMPVVPPEPTPASATVAEPEASQIPAHAAATLSDSPPRPVVAAQSSLPSGNRGGSLAPGKAAESMPAAPDMPSIPAAPQTIVPVSGYMLQVGVFSDPQHAAQLQARLQREGHPASIESRVLVGPFSTRKEAEATRRQLKESGLAPVLLPPKKGTR